MRTYLPIATVLVAGFLITSAASPAQTPLPLPGCEAPPEVRKVLDSDLSNLDDTMKFPEQIAYTRKTLDDLIAKYPREIEPYVVLANRMHQFAPEQYPAIRDQQIKMATDNPNDPLALVLASDRLMGRDTPQALKLLQAARAKAPDFPWPALRLAGFYTDGKLADPEKVKQNIDAFYALCPTSTAGYAQFLLGKDPPLQAKVLLAIATSMRARLEKETDPKKLQDYSTLWKYEFRAHPPKEHDAVRAQIALDLKRLEALVPKGDADWQALLINGYKQSGAPKEVVTAKQDQLLHDFPHSSRAYRIVNERWDETHPAPKDGTDTAAWAKFQHESDVAIKQWLHDFPDDKSLQRYSLFENYQDDDALTEQEGIAAVDHYLQVSDDYRGPYWKWATYPSAARLLLDHGWQPARALDLMKQVRIYDDTTFAENPLSDNATDEEREQYQKGHYAAYLRIDLQLLKAAMLANLPDEALKLKTTIEAPPPTDKSLLSDYWFRRARLEAVQNHKQDALAYYQLALQTRTYVPKAYQGRVRDDLNAEAHGLWIAQGGTETAFSIWSKPATTTADSKDKVTEGGWEIPKHVIPAFTLQDLSGKTWKLADLEGKTLLINVWATWCGPCQQELPLLQKFYEKTKDRADIQVLTFDVDANFGIVAPFVKGKGFTFPVLSAYSMDAVQYGGIPQSWIVDQHGITRWWHMGFDSGTYEDFEKDTLLHLEAAKTAK
jgi:thiol-disulfide isomerase/thioredoxin